MNETTNTIGMGGGGGGGFVGANGGGGGGLSSSSSSLNLPFATNPFEETNRFRLEQSVLSPNIFQLAHTSTPDRDTNSLWNIDQRAILYPADIPTDESSLMAQYLYEQRMNNQVSAALETFWTKNKVIIESPLATSAASSSAIRSKFFFKNSGGGGSTTSSGSVTDYSGGVRSTTTTTKQRFGSYSVNSPLCVDNMKPPGSGGGATGYSNNAAYYSANQYQRYYYQQNYGNSENRNNHGATTNSSQQQKRGSGGGGQSKRVVMKRDQGSQTVLTLPVNFDLSQVKELRPFFVHHTVESSNTNEEYPSSSPAPTDRVVSQQQLNNSIRKKLFDPNSDDLSSTATTTTAMSVAAAAAAAGDITHQNGNISRLPKPDLPLIHGFMPSLSDDDCFDRSFEFDGRQYSSSPKQNKFRTILCDIGDDDYRGDQAGAAGVAARRRFSAHDPFPCDDSVFMPPSSSNDNMLNDNSSMSNHNNHHQPSDNLGSPFVGFSAVTPEKQIFHFDKQVELLAAGGGGGSSSLVSSNIKSNSHQIKSSGGGGGGCGSSTARPLASPISANLYTKSVTRQHLNRYIHFEAAANRGSSGSSGSDQGPEVSIKELNVFSEVLSSSKKMGDDDEHRRTRSNTDSASGDDHAGGGPGSPNLSPIRLDSLKSIFNDSMNGANNINQKFEPFVESLGGGSIKKDHRQTVSPMNRTDQTATYHHSDTTTVNTSGLGAPSTEKSLSSGGGGGGFRPVSNNNNKTSSQRRTSMNNTSQNMMGGLSMLVGGSKHSNNLTATFNTQDSCLAGGQDTGYQTNSGHLGNGSNSSSGSYGLQFNNTDLTNTTNTTNNRLFKNRKNVTSMMNTSNGRGGGGGGINMTNTMSMDEENDDEGQCSMEEEYYAECHYSANRKSSPTKSSSKKLMKRHAHAQKAEHNNHHKSSTTPCKTTTTGSISINSLQSIQPVESSTPEKLKSKAAMTTTTTTSGKSGGKSSKLVKTQSSSGVGIFTNSNIKKATSPQSVNNNTPIAQTQHKKPTCSLSAKSLLAKSKTSHDLVPNSSQTSQVVKKKQPVEFVAKNAVAATKTNISTSYKLTRKVEILRPLSTNNRTVDMSLDQSVLLDSLSSSSNQSVNQPIIKTSGTEAVVSASDYSSMVIQNARIEFINSLKYLRQKENEIE